ncbi:unnamed protein product, partial [Musa textilis]
TRSTSGSCAVRSNRIADGFRAPPFSSDKPCSRELNANLWLPLDPAAGRRSGAHDGPSPATGEAAPPLEAPAFLGFSSFARSLLFSHSAPSPDPSASSKPEDGIVELKPPSKIERVESEQEDDEEAEVEMMQADFGFFDPKPGDFNGVKLLLRNYLDDKQWDLSGFVDLILEQTTVGTVVKLDEHDEAGDGGTGMVMTTLALLL